MKKILFILGCFFLLTSINSASAQNWTQVNTDGFGDANNKDSVKEGIIHGAAV